ncbi:MAG TPA: hypothetical protein QF480_04590 [Bacteroidales bacterium]|jgi:hypothetical protein|nr:hypothetical protein [Bacteroidota bacterium]MAE09221.1 hypothetical protein [Bacteroidota bacterium]MDP7197038.1 hypothetical protein [SAR202 cluster bacterium]HJN05869.1 hypothetical protein [Bacteroidales bacterium]|tara:strand:+ start:167 stop:811 length:645 start_codon:yes stop_codon:yes gene_type:complete
MKNFCPIIKLRLAIGLLISILFIISSCSIAGYKPVANSEEYQINKLYIFDNDFKKALYKTNINIYGNNLTGLTLMKKTDSAMRVVSMSELGIKYFDFEFPDDTQKEFKVHYVMEPLNKEFVINKISKEFTFMFFLPDITRSQIKIFRNDSSNLIIKHKNLVYFFDQSGAVTKICLQRWPLHLKSIISLSDYKHSFPETIFINKGKISIDLELID